MSAVWAIHETIVECKKDIPACLPTDNPAFTALFTFNPVTDACPYHVVYVLPELCHGFSPFGEWLLQVS